MEDVPAPLVGRGQLLIGTRCSLVSAGTERMLVQFGRAHFVEKARQQPDKVRQLLKKVRTDGLSVTLEAVRTTLDQPLTSGYCNVGRVLEVGSGVSGFSIGDRVASNGKHADVVLVPQNLCARIPEAVSDEAASFTVLGAIALQGIRLANPTIGECIVVTGLGLVGLLTVQILRAHGCRVLGIDFDPARLQLARGFGAEVVNPAAGEDVLAVASAFSRGRGVDAVIITAATSSSEPVSQAARMSRKRGRIVLVGVTGLELNRSEFYEKELIFQVSCSYGPGRYDPSYELGGQDYPFGFVRWTEQRNFEAVLDLMSTGALNVQPLISHRFEIERAAEAINLLTADMPSLGILLNYGADYAAFPTRSVTLAGPGEHTSPTKCNVAFIGAGNYAGRILIPAFRRAGAGLRTIVSGGGVSAVHFGKKFGFENASTDINAVLVDADIDTLVIATRHNVHAAQVLAALRAGKHVFCEKPLCLTIAELDDIEAECSNRPLQQVMVGFNRRFSPHVLTIKSLLATVSEPKNFVLTINAGAIPADNWTQDLEIGGGRIIGEVCHFIDLLRHLSGSRITDYRADTLGNHPSLDVVSDKTAITLKFADGSLGVINYLANGARGFPKERIEVFCAGRVLQLDNFRRLRGWGWPGFSRQNLWRQDKGQSACVGEFVAAVRTGSTPPIPREEIFEVSRVTIAVAAQARK